MTAIAIERENLVGSGVVVRATLLDLVWRAGATGDGESTIVETVSRQLLTGRTRLTGNFRDAPIKEVLGTAAGGQTHGER